MTNKEAREAEYLHRMELYNQGLTDRQMGERLYLTRASVESWRHRHGLKKTTEYILNVEEFERLTKEKGWNIGCTAEKCNLSYSQIRSMCQFVDSPEFSPVGHKSYHALKKVFPNSPNLFIPLKRENEEQSAERRPV